jgi:hypothetical protein
MFGDGQFYPNQLEHIGYSRMSGWSVSVPRTFSPLVPLLFIHGLSFHGLGNGLECTSLVLPSRY